MRSPGSLGAHRRRSAGRYAVTRAWMGRYRPHHAERAARERARRPRQRLLVVDVVHGDAVRELLGQRWSPEQVVHELAVRFAGQRRRCLCAESIYQAIYDPGVDVTRPARRRRRRRRLRGEHRRGRLLAMRMIGERPAEVEDRVQAGHWEGDLIMGTGNRSAIGTLVERSTRYLILLHLQDGVSTAETVALALGTALASLPASLRRTLTWDQGKELPAPADHRHDRCRRVLLRPALTVAARQQREHERPPARLLPQGHRPDCVHRGRASAGRRRGEPAATQDARLEPTRRPVLPRAHVRRVADTLPVTPSSSSSEPSPGPRGRSETRTRSSAGSAHDSPSQATGDHPQPHHARRNHVSPHNRTRPGCPQRGYDPSGVVSDTRC